MVRTKGKIDPQVTYSGCRSLHQAPTMYPAPSTSHYVNNMCVRKDTDVTGKSNTHQRLQEKRVRMNQPTDTHAVRTHAIM